MFLKIDTIVGRVDVHEADDLRSFSVRHDGRGDITSVEQALAPLGTVDASGHAWIDVELLRAASGKADDAVWSAEFDGMVAYAASKGWLDESGTALRAHLERSD